MVITVYGYWEDFKELISSGTKKTVSIEEIEKDIKEDVFMFDRYEIVIENEDGKGYPITLTKKLTEYPMTLRTDGR